MTSTLVGVLFVVAYALWLYAVASRSGLFGSLDNQPGAPVTAPTVEINCNETNLTYCSICNCMPAWVPGGGTSTSASTIKKDGV